ncbi:TonB-dependent receptor [Marinilabiliaceae bacterium ANBcel2]|nr:TonB-dependent receptor [Marinilabiliaceae bacterium ANBcel2]
MRKIFFAFIFSLLIVGSTYGQILVEGRVINEESESLVGAVVILNDTYTTVTGGDGEFSFQLSDNIESLNITVSFLGYKMVEENLYIEKSEDITVVMQEDSHLTPEVVVSAYRAGHKTPVAHTNISGDQLRGNAVNEDIPFLLQRAPSVVATSESGIGVGYTGFRIRGTDPTRINVTMNGVPLNDAESQDLFWANMPDFAESVDEVQIQRGVGTSSSGGAAFGASVNMRTSSGSPDPFAEIVSSAGSYNTFRNSIKVGTGLIDDKFSFESRYSKLDSDGYIHNSFSNHQSLFLSGTLFMDNSFLKANLIHGDQQTGISWWGVPDYMIESNRRYNPAGVYTDVNGEEAYYDDQTDNYKQTHYQLFYSYALNNYHDFTAAVHYTRGEGYYEQYREEEDMARYGLPYFTIGGDEIESSDLVRQKWMDNDFYGFVVSSNNRLSNSLTASFGGGWNRYDGDHFGNIIWSRYAVVMDKDYEWYSNNGLKTDYHFFGKFNWDIGLVNLFGDLQYRGVEYKMSGIDDDLRDLSQDHTFNFFNPKAGLFYDISSNQSSYLSFGVSNREPTRTNFKDANLDPEVTPQAERLYNIETGYTYKSPQFSGGINLYYMRYKDQLVPTGEKSNVGYDIMTNVEDSYRAGIETEFSWLITNGLRWDANFTLSRNRIRDFVKTAPYYEGDNFVGEVQKHLGSVDIAYSPSLIGNSLISYDLTESWSLTFNSKYIGEQYFDNTSSDQRKLESFFVHDLSFNYNFSFASLNKLMIRGTVNNLFNLKYESNAYGASYYDYETEYTWAYYYPMAPRNFMFELLMRF